MTSEEFGLNVNNDMFVVSDNEPKIVGAFNVGTTRVGCSAHYIIKVIEHELESDKSVCSAVQNLYMTVGDIISPFVNVTSNHLYLCACIIIVKHASVPCTSC